MDENRPMTKRERQEARRLEKLANSGSGGSSNLIKWIILGGGSLLFVAAFLFIVFLIKQDQGKPIVLSAEGYSRGSGKVTLVEVGDFQCPACRAYEPFVRNLSHDFSGKLKVHFKNFPLTSVHPNAMLAAKIAVAAGNQGKFWEMHDWLYDNQDSWAGLSGADAKAKILEQAKSMKLDINLLNMDIDNKKTEDTISKTQSEGIDAGVNATPTFYLDNKKIETNPQGYDDFKKLVQAEIDANK